MQTVNKVKANQRPVVLVDVYQIFSDRTYLTDQPYVPLALCYLTGSLKQAGYSVKSWHLSSDEMDDLVDRIHAFNPLFVGVVNVLVGRKLHFSHLFSQKIRQINPQIPIVWGGYFPTSSPEICLKSPCVDVVGLGDGEETVIDLANYYGAALGLEEIPGIAWMQEGQLKTTFERSVANNLDSYRPDYSIINLPDYITSFKGRPMLQNGISTSRGCPYKCSFCCHAAVKTTSWRCHSSAYVAGLLHELKQKADFEYISVADDNFGANKKHMHEIVNILRRLEVKPVTFTVRIKNFERKDIRKLNEAGIESIFFGAESFLSRKLTLFNKKHQVDDIYRGIKLFNQYQKPNLQANIIVGVPGESREELLQDLKLAFSEAKFPGRVVMSFSLFFPLPATPMLKLAVKHGFKEPRDIEGWAKVDNENIWDLFTQWIPWITEKERKNLKIAWRYSTEILYFPNLDDLNKIVRWLAYLAVQPAFYLARFRIKYFFFTGHKIDFVYQRLLHICWRIAEKIIRMTQSTPTHTIDHRLHKNPADADNYSR